MKKLMPLLLILCTLLLSACGLFDSSYVVESDYALPSGKENDTGDALNVSNLSELREAVRSIVARGGENQSILFGCSSLSIESEKGHKNNNTKSNFIFHFHFSPLNIYR